jgi:hypothetical protein
MNNWIYWVVFVSLSIMLFFFVNKLAYGEYGKPNSALSRAMITEEILR